MDKCCPSIHWRGGRAGEAVESMFLSPQTRKPICDKWVNSKGADNWPYIAMLHTTWRHFFYPPFGWHCDCDEGHFQCTFRAFGRVYQQQPTWVVSIHVCECTWPPPRPSGCQSMERCNGNVEKDGEERRRTRGADKFTFEKNFMGIGQLHSAKRRRSGFGERR